MAKKYMRKHKATPELPAMDMGPLTRARKMALLEETTAPAGPAAPAKRRKVLGPEFRPRKKRPAVSLSSDVRSVAPRCSSGNDGGSCEVEGKRRLRSAADLEVVVSGGLAAAAGNRSGHRREASAMAEDELECPATTTPPEASKLPAAAAAEMPPAGEINAFFAAAEERERARFADKYNFDVKKDAPVEGGRYEWVRLK